MRRSTGPVETSLFPQLLQSSIQSTWMQGLDYAPLLTVEAVKNEIDTILTNPNPVVVIDLETSGLDSRIIDGKVNDFVAGIAIASSGTRGRYIPIQHREGISVPFADIFPYIQRLLNTAVTVFHNAKFDRQWLSRLGLSLREYPYFKDTLLLTYIENCDRGKLGLKEISQTVLGIKMLELSDVLGKNNYDFSKVDASWAFPYPCSDAMVTFRLYEKLAQVEQDFPIICRMEHRVNDVMRYMDDNRLLVDASAIGPMKQQLMDNITNIEKTIYEYVGKEFNINSGQQLGEALFDHLKLPPTDRSKKSGQYVTNEKSLTKLASKHPVIKLILSYKHCNKHLNSFVVPLSIDVAKYEETRIDFFQCGAETGRFSCHKGNFDNGGYCGASLQTVPSHNKKPNMSQIRVVAEESSKVCHKWRWVDGKRICNNLICDKSHSCLEGDVYEIDIDSYVPLRKVFVSHENWSLVSVDYSGIELRLACILSGEPKWIEVFQNNGDLHALTAASIYKIPIEKVLKWQRDNGKTLNFSLQYGATQYLISERLGISQNEAQGIIDAFWQGVPTLNAYFQRLKSDVLKTGFVTTAFGRIRRFPGITNENLQDSLLRAACNTPIQGTGADIIKIAMIRLHEFISKNNLYDKIRMLLTVHDEIVFEIRNDSIAELVPKIEEIMVLADMVKSLNWPIPLVVESECGKSWGDGYTLNEWLEVLAGKTIVKTGKWKKITEISKNTLDKGETPIYTLSLKGVPCVNEIKFLSGALQLSPGTDTVIIEMDQGTYIRKYVNIAAIRESLKTIWAEGEFFVLSIKK